MPALLQKPNYKTEIRTERLMERAQTLVDYDALLICITSMSARAKRDEALSKTLFSVFKLTQT